MRIGITTYLKPALLGHGEQRAGCCRPAAPASTMSLLHVGQRVDQVGDVEADLDGVAAVVDLQLFLGFFLLGVAGRDAQAAGLDVACARP